MEISSLVAVVRQAQPLQNCVDPVAAGGLPAIFQPGKAHRFTDAVAKLLLSQAQVQPPLLDVLAKKDVFQGCIPPLQ